jgi:4'-phosphopantetheinyl transferase
MTNATAAWAVADTARFRPPRHGECHVWLGGLGAAHPHLAGLLLLLDPEERRHASALRRIEDRDRFVASRALLRLLLARYLKAAPSDLELDRTCAACGAGHGKPRLVGPRRALEFSVAHSGEQLLFAVTRGMPVGVDVERLEQVRELDPLLTSVLAPWEVAELPVGHDERLRGFLAYWVRKEAVVKATGEGLGRPLTSFTVSAPNRPARLLTWAGAPGAAAGIELRDLDVDDGYLACLAVVGSCQRLRYREIDDLLTAPDRTRRAPPGTRFDRTEPG